MRSRWPSTSRHSSPSAGFETYYDDMATVTSPAEALAIQAKYGITFHGDLARQLISRHRLRTGDLPQNWH